MVSFITICSASPVFDGSSIADILVSPLFGVVRSRHVPTVLRTSSLSLLGECVGTYAFAILPYVEDLSEAMLDLLQIETVAARPEKVKQEETSDSPITMDSEPTSTNAKLPALRRAALHFLSLLIRETTKQTYESSQSHFMFSNSVMRRASAILNYIASTDEDNVVRVMAREAGEGLDSLREAIMGV